MTGRRRRSDRSGRAPLFSPGRPVVAGRDQQRRFWAAIAAGRASEDAAVQAGMSQAVGTRLFRKAGGMPPAMFRPSVKPLSGRYLSFAEREEIALLRVQGCSMREVARRLGRTASTILRELRRNAATRSGGLEYRATTAQWHADRSARRPKQAKLALNAALRTYCTESNGWYRAAVEFDQNGLGRLGPDEGFGAGVVLREISIDGGLQVGNRAENATADALPRHLREKVLDGVEPGGRGRGEVEGPARMTRQPGQHPGMLVGGIVVEDDMDRPIGRDLALDGVQEANEFDMAVALHAAANDGAVEHAKSSEQGGGAVP